MYNKYRNKGINTKSSLLYHCELKYKSYLAILRRGLFKERGKWNDMGESMDLELAKDKGRIRERKMS